MRTILTGALFAALATVPAAYAQKFEVASIKRCQDSERGGRDAPSPGRIDLSCMATINLIRMAYLVFPTGQPNAPVSPTIFQVPITGGPSWMNTDRYRIVAKAEGPANLELMKGPMLQSLLEDRFQLKLHRASKEIDVFELTAGKSWSKLRPAKEGGCVAFDRNHPPETAAAGRHGPATPNHPCGQRGGSRGRNQG